MKMADGPVPPTAQTSPGEVPARPVRLPEAIAGARTTCQEEQVEPDNSVDALIGLPKANTPSSIPLVTIESLDRFADTQLTYLSLDDLLSCRRWPILTLCVKGLLLCWSG